MKRDQIGTGISGKCRVFCTVGQLWGKPTERGTDTEKYGIL